jgi:hypothetical protein
VTVEVELHELLVEIFTQAVMDRAALPAARRGDAQDAPAFSSRDGDILCTCDITGSTYSERWDGTTASAKAFAQEVGEATASLVARTKKNHKYAWLYASR